MELYGIKSKILKSGRSLRQLNPSEIESIRRIANNTRAEAAVQANNILCVAIGECKKLDVPRMSSNTVINRSVQNSSSNTSISLLKGNEVFTVYPNPASNNIHVDYNLPDKFNDAYISLVDFTGKEVMRQKVNAQQGQLIWQTEQLKIGFYIISIVADNHSVGQSKLSIQK